MFESLFQPIDLGPTHISNRVFVPAHGTTLGRDGRVTEELIAYHQARARGGAGLIILEGMTIHPSYGFEESFLYAGSDKIMPGISALAKACHHHGTSVFGQLFHAGRAVRLSHDGSRPLTYSASDVPDERYRVVAVPMSVDLIWQIVESYANAAGRLVDAGLDGIEILAGMGYLISQFLNPATNRRTDEFGGSTENRLRLLQEIINHCRRRIGRQKTLGLRITLDEKTNDAMDPAQMLDVCIKLDQSKALDYFNVAAGSSSAPEGWAHIFPPMAVAPGFVAADAARIKKAVATPVLVAGRINQPQVARDILDSGQADMVGMARAMIADPEFVNKVAQNRSADIRSCVACNQACVGHRLAHHPVSCIQNPVSGREKLFFPARLSANPTRVLIIGGGPAGMKAAVTACERGHQVFLYERQGKLGGQVNMAERLPGREEFGGVTTNLEYELARAGAEVMLNVEVTPAMVSDVAPSTVIVATGAVARTPEVEIENTELIDAWQVIQGASRPGHNVVVADWSCDWTGLGVAHLLALAGHSVQLLSGAAVAGESLQGIVRDQWIGELHKLGVTMIPFARFHGAQDGTAYFEHMSSGEPIIREGVDTIVTCFAPRSHNEVYQQIQADVDFEITVHTIGDALSPRTVEEAVLEGFQTAWSL